MHVNMGMVWVWLGVLFPVLEIVPERLASMLCPPFFLSFLAVNYVWGVAH